MTAAAGDWRQFGEVTPNIIAECEFAATVSTLTESPIETIFGVAMAKMLTQKYGADFGLCENKAEFDTLDMRALMMPQYVWQRYRIDWALRFKALPRPLVFVECDGAEFHCTPEQLARDRAKDEAAKDAGIPLIRFAGTDIVRNMGQCLWNFRMHAWGGLTAP